MKLITRRRFAALAGLGTVAGAVGTGLSQHAQDQAAPKKPAANAVDTKVSVAEIKVVDRATASPQEIWNDMMEGNKRFVSGKTRPRDVIGARAKTATAQHPYVTVLCCSDSRLSPELIFDQSIGDLFVIRTAGNIADPIALGSMEYAFEHLHSRMLVILGHERCGAVSATLSGEAMPTENLKALVDMVRPGIERLKGLVQGDTLMNLAVEANVHHSAKHVVESSPIVRTDLASDKLTIVKAVYKLGTGEVLKLS